MVHQGQQGRGLTGLTRGVEDEVALLPDQHFDLVQIDAMNGVEAVVLAAINWPGIVEEALAHSQFPMRMKGAQ